MTGPVRPLIFEELRSRYIHIDFSFLTPDPDLPADPPTRELPVQADLPRHRLHEGAHR